MLARRHLGIVAQHASLLVDQARDAPGGAGRGVVGGAVLEREALVGVAEEREGEGELGGEGGVLGLGVEARAQDRGVQLLEVADSITESDPLGRSARGVGLGEEVEQDLLAAEVPETDAAAVMRRGREVGRGIAGFQHSRNVAHSVVRRNGPQRPW